MCFVIPFCTNVFKTSFQTRQTITGGIFFSCTDWHFQVPIVEDINCELFTYSLQDRGPLASWVYWDYFIGGERAPYTLRLDHFVSNPLESPFGQALALLKGLRILDLSRILAGHGGVSVQLGMWYLHIFAGRRYPNNTRDGKRTPCFFWFRIILGNFTSYKHVWNSCGFEVWDELQNNLWIHRNSHISPVGWLWSSSAQDLLQQCWWLTWVRRSLRWKHPNQGMTPAVAASDKRFFWMDSFGSVFFCKNPVSHGSTSLIFLGTGVQPTG